MLDRITCSSNTSVTKSQSIKRLINLFFNRKGNPTLVFFQLFFFCLSLPVKAHSDPEFAYEITILQPRSDSLTTMLSQGDEIFIRENMGGTAGDLIKSYNVSERGELTNEQSINRPDGKPWVWRNFFAVDGDNLIILDGAGLNYVNIFASVPFIYRKNANGKWEYISVLEDKEATRGYEKYAGIEDDVIVVKRNQVILNDDPNAALVFYKYQNNAWQKIDEAVFPESKQYFGYSLTLENGVALYTGRNNLLVFKQVSENDWEFSNTVEYPQSPTYNLEVWSNKLRIYETYEYCDLGMPEEYKYSFSFLNYENDAFVESTSQCLLSPASFPMFINGTDLFTQHYSREASSFQPEVRGYFLRHHKLVDGKWLYRGTIQSSTQADAFNPTGGAGDIGGDIQLVNGNLFVKTTFNISVFSKGDVLEVEQTSSSENNVYNNNNNGKLSFNIANFGSDVVEDISLMLNVPQLIRLESTNQNCLTANGQVTCTIQDLNGYESIEFELEFSVIGFGEQELTMTVASPKGTAYSDKRTLSYSFLTNDVPRVTDSSTSITNDEYIEFVLAVEDENNSAHIINFLQNPQFGSLSSYVENGVTNFTYTPNEGAKGVERLEYYASDSYSDSNVAVLEIIVTDVEVEEVPPVIILTPPSAGGTLSIGSLLWLVLVCFLLKVNRLSKRF